MISLRIRDMANIARWVREGCEMSLIIWDIRKVLGEYKMGARRVRIVFINLGNTEYYKMGARGVRDVFKH
jgi:hypothetical protein